MTDYSTLDDAALVKHASNDAEAFAVLYHRYLTPVYRYLYRRLGNEKDAEDLTAQVFTEALEGLAVYRERGRFASWLFTIARNVATDHFRRGGREFPLEVAGEQVESASVEETVQQYQDFTELVSILSKFPPRERELVALKYGAGLTNREIARLTRLSETNVGTILNRTVEKLRVEMEVDHER